MKSNKETIQELVDIIFERINTETGGNKFMFIPVINVIKLKLANMSDDDATFIIDAVHKISSQIEIETGILSPYHGAVIESDASENLAIAKAG